MIWVKIKKINDHKNVIYLPKSVGEKLPKQVKLQFGMRSTEVIVQSSEKEYEYENTFESPLEIQLSTQVISELLIKDTPVYQLIYEEKTMRIGPVIGFLMGEQSYYYHDSNMSGLTIGMGLYPDIGGLFITFKDISIDWNNMQIYGLYFDYEKNKWVYDTLPLPSAVFRRAFYTSPKVAEKLKGLTGNKVFNSKRFDKWETYKIMINNLKFKEYLPETQEIKSEEIFNNFIKKYNRIILKPAGLSKGRGICFVHKIENGFSIYDYRNSEEPKFYILKNEEFHEYLLNNFIDKDYIMQPQLELAVINGAPFDIRIVMGKNEDKSWHCRGIECRLAGSKNKITNISRGGQALSINNAIRLSFGHSVDSNKVRDELISIAKEFCIFIDETGEHFAEFGLDFAIDSQMRYWFIEANVRPAFRGFKSMDYDNYLHIRYMPLYYAASISGFGKEERENEPKI